MGTQGLVGEKSKKQQFLFLRTGPAARPGSYLRFLHLNDPGGRDNDGRVGPQGAGFLDVVQHEAGHLIVKLKRKTGP